MRIWLLILLLALPCVAFPQACKKQVSLATALEPVDIFADNIDFSTPVLCAEGHVLFRQGVKHIYANRLVINTTTGIGQLTGVTVTTCCLPKPDYRLTAREITMSPDMQLRAKGVRIYLWNIRLISLPSLSFVLGHQTDNQSFVPRPGFGRYDGFFLSGRYPLATTAKADVDIFIKPTTKAGIQGGTTGGFAIRGDTRLAPPYVPDSDSELRRQTLLKPVVATALEYSNNYFNQETSDDEANCRHEECAFPVEQPHPSLLAAFGALLRTRVYDVNDPNLIVTRLPELGVRYVSPQVNVLGKNGCLMTGLQSETRLSWGRFDETGENEFIGRSDVRSLATSTLTSLGKSAALRGAVLARYSTYTTGQSYEVLGGLVDVSRIFPNGSFSSIRLIGHAIGGTTPLQFDSVDIPFELQGAGRYVRGKNAYGLILDYDLSENSLRDWQFSISHRFHCLEPSIAWHNRFGQISLNMQVVGF